MQPIKIKKILIASRGEIALRILRTCQSMGIKTVAIYTEPDKQQKHLRLADETVCIGEAYSYVNIEHVITAALATKADAVHPGYGFLAENADFADQLAAHNIRLIGPSSDLIRLMGNKVTAKECAQKLGIPCVPGSTPVTSIAHAQQIGKTIGYPVMLKASAGGAGRGMRIIHHEDDLPKILEQAQKEALTHFGSDQVYLEKYIHAPRHIEVQILADTYGHVLCLGSRDCSIQRKHQKIVEESPPPGIPDDILHDIYEKCITACEKMGYSSAGTIEFLYKDGHFYFIEMNTRIQVEHPITEVRTGIDIVKEQIDIASGKSYEKSAIVPQNGSAIECRICAEDPDTYAPHPGTITEYHMPSGPGIRVDDYVYHGYRIPHHYDSMIAKIIAHSTDRESCVRKTLAALNECLIGGIKTNIPLLKRILTHPEFEKQPSILFLDNNMTGENHDRKTTKATAQ